MTKNGKLTPFEWEIMKLFWQEGTLSVRDVMMHLPDEFQRAYTTVQTYIERLSDKKYLTKEKSNNINLYSPVVQEQTALRNETERFVSHAFNGSFSSLAAYLVKSGKLTDDDIEELQALVKKQKEEL